MSRGHTGLRVVKPRTDKQRAAADRYKGRASLAPWIVPPASPGPVTSWWIGISRDELQEKAREEQAPHGVVEVRPAARVRRVGVNAWVTNQRSSGRTRR